MSTSIKPLSDKDRAKLLGVELPPKPNTQNRIAEPSVEEQIDPELLEAIREHEEYIPMEFQDPIELLMFIDDNFRTGRKKLHVWQEEELLRLALTGIYTFAEPLKHLIVAANGSGKDAFVNALFCLWKLVSRVRTRTIVTSASYIQLKNQTENYIRTYAAKLNSKLATLGVHPKACIIKREHIGCNLTGSEIVMFVTDDPGRAEGYHPWPDYGHNVNLKETCVIDGKKTYPGGDVTIIMNEAKTVPDVINDAISRCTYNILLKISSPGHTAGHLYQDSRKAVEYPAPYDKTKIYLRRITSYDCPHISRIKIEQDKEYYGENSPIFRSKHLALFTSIGEQIVILRETIQACLDYNATKLDIGLGRRAGLDLAQGGDENTLYIFDENILIGYEAFTMVDTHAATKVIIDMFRKWSLKDINIFGDDGVAGHGHIDNLWAAGWNINRVRNQSPAVVKQHYGNRGAEMWFNFARLIQEKILNLSKAPPKAIDQLSSRYYKQQETLGKLILESKKEARIGGHGSPDHADAMVLAFTGVTIDDFRGKRSERGDKEDKIISPQEAIWKERDKAFEELKKQREKKTIKGSNFQSLIRKLTT